MAGTSTSTYAVLGLLSIAPMSGYEAARAAQRSISYFWPISKTHVYSELARLEALGWVEGDEVRQDALPDKRVFQITPAGERGLDEWLVSEEAPEAVFRIPMLIKMFIGHRIPRDRMLEMLRSYREDAEAERRNLEEIVRSLDLIEKAVFPRATALYGLLVAEAVVRWTEEMEALIPARRVKLNPRGKDAAKARGLFESAPPAPAPRRKR